MVNRIKKILFSVPVITAVAVFALYLVVGFLALPALLKWQLEKQVRESLGHQLSVAQLRFNPLNFKFDADELALADGEGRPMFGFKHLHVDFELRSVIDGAWTFADATLDAPTLQFTLDKDGRNNFSALLDQLASDDTEPKPAGALPRFAVHRVALTDGRIEFSDQLLAEPLITRIEPLRLEIDQLSSLPETSARFRLSVPTAAGESLESSGELALTPMAAKGKLSLNDLEVATLVRGLSRLVTLESPAGKINLGANFDLAVQADGALSGTVQDVDLVVAQLSVTAPGPAASKLAIDAIELKQGRVGFEQREARFATLRIANGSVAASTDAQGRLDWANIVRVATASPHATAASASASASASAPAPAPAPASAVPATPASAPTPSSAATPTAAAASAAALPASALAAAPASAPSSVPASSVQAASAAAATTAAPPAAKPDTTAPAGWRILVDGAELSAIAVNYTDASRSRNASIAAVAFNAAPDAEFAPGGMRIGLGKPRISVAGLQLRDGANALALPEAAVEAARLSMATAGPRLELALDAPRVAAGQGLSTKQGEASLELTSASVQGERVALDLSGAALTAAIEVPRLLLTGVVAGQGGQGARLGEHSFEARRIALRSAPPHFEVDIEALRSALANLKVEAGEQGLDLRAASVNGGTLSVAQTDAGVRLVAGAPVVSLSGLAARQGADQAALDVLTLEGATATLTNASGGKLDLALDRVKAAADKLAVKQGSAEASLDRMSLDGATVTLTGAGEGKLDLALKGIQAAADKLALKQGENGLDLGKVSLGGESMSLAQAGARIGIDAAGARASLAGVAGRQGRDRIALQDASFETRTLSVSTGGAAPAAPASAVRAATATGGASAPAASPTATSSATSAASLPAVSGPVQARLEQASLRLTSLGVVALGAGADIAGVSAASLDAGSLRLALPEGGPELSGDGLNATLSGAVLRSPADATELVQLGSASLGNGALALRERSFSADKLALANGKASTWLDAEGRFNLTTLFAAGPPSPTEPTTPPAVAPAEQASAPAWRIALKSAELDGLAVGFEDRRETPAFAVGLEALSARLTGLDTGAAAPMQVAARTGVNSGGEIEATGTVHAGSGASDLNLKVSALALAPVQSYLSKFAELRLASGSASTEGQLRYGNTAEGGAKLAYQGALSVDRLLLEEVAPQRPFLSWESVATSDLMLTLAPNKVDIGELRVVQPAGRLIIADDQSVNLTDVLKKPKDEPGEVAEKKPAQGDAAADQPFPVTIARLRVDGGMLEFADLSLRPQFAARMHDLKGVITGLGTDADQSAQIQLDARVDKFGSARIRGQLSVLQPERLTDIEMTFRNLEMTSLSPYVVRFAGYRIAAGRLALDLQYKVKASKLLGRNKVVLQQVALGEKVESPGALDLPLELAVAILKDSKGVIDIELPVSGDLNDPKFDYGAVIGKAVGNMLGGIVTAPFRALGALFGGGVKEIDTIEFEPGSDAIAPPEAQKLAAVARALTERPTLTLVVPPTYAADHDTPVLKSRAVRGAIAARMGLSVPSGEDPGPIDAANPRAQRAIEEVFSQRYAPEVLAVLKGRAIAELAPKASPVAPPASAPSPSPAPVPPAPSASPASAAAAKPPAPPPGPPAAFYKNLLDRLISEQPMDEQELAAFATRRGEAIVRALTDTGGVPAERVKLDKPRAAAKADDKTVVVRLELEVKR